MKLKTIGLLTCASIIGLSASANAGIMDFYVGGTLGLGGQTLLTKDLTHSKSSNSYGIITGVDIPLFRFELEYNGIETKRTDFHNAMINGYFKLPTPIIKPYIGVGGGYIFHSKVGNNNVGKKAAYQAMTGITFDIPILPLKIDVEGRLLYSKDIYTMDHRPDLLHYDGRVKLRYIF